VARLRFFPLEHTQLDQTFCVSHSAIRQANPLANSFGAVDSVWIEAELRAGFLVRYTTGDLADCAWDFVKESA
jgi:hypothetical protein